MTPEDAVAYAARILQDQLALFVHFDDVVPQGHVPQMAGMGLHLGMDVPNWPPENIEDLAKKFEDQI